MALRGRGFCEYRGPGGLTGAELFEAVRRSSAKDGSARERAAVRALMVQACSVPAEEAECHRVAQRVARVMVARASHWSAAGTLPAREPAAFGVDVGAQGVRAAACIGSRPRTGDRPNEGAHRYCY